MGLWEGPPSQNCPGLEKLHPRELEELTGRLPNGPQIQALRRAGKASVLETRQTFWFSGKEGGFLEPEASGLVIIPSMTLKRIN